MAPVGATSASRRKRPSADGDAPSQAAKRARPAAPTTTIVLGAGPHHHQIAEVQSARCNTTRYKQRNLAQCFACVRRRGGDTCRFQNVRVILTKDVSNSVVTGISHVLANAGFDDYIETRRPKLDFPDAWNELLTDIHVGRIKTTIAKALLPALQQELEHLSVEGREVIWRALEHDVRATCDTCLTSIFSGTWMCRICGREICADCYARIGALWPPSKGPLSDEQKNLLTCMRSGHHQRANFLATSRFTRPELEKVIAEMHQLLLTADEPSFTSVPAASALPAPSTSALVVRASPVRVSPVRSGSSAADGSGASGLVLLATVAGQSPRMPVTNRLPSSPGGSVSSSESSLRTPQTASPPPSTVSPPPGLSTRASAKPSTKPTSPAIIASDDGPLASLSHATASSPAVLSQARASPVVTSQLSTLPPVTPKTRSSPPMSSPLSSPPPSLSTRPFPPDCEFDRIGLPIHRTPVFTETQLNEDVFRELWSRGRPLVVRDILHKFQVPWTPEYFIQKYGAEPCALVECQTERVRDARVADFFRLFEREREGDGLWKLKDWPPSADFAQAFPELYADFARAVPVPTYTRRDGALNIASHFPANTVRPDLGPKMYNALASQEGAGSMGSTRLHMDIADAVNVMLYASHPPCATAAARAHPPCAAWDLFRAEDADTVREFLRKRFGSRADEDPIHAQKYYLDAELRRTLWEDHGVMSHRVYQRPGDVVFIPAGCAHQVCNFADCIKVAVDFVSPENVARCARITEELRAINISHVWKEDVLQLRAMMWYAWLSCARKGVVRRTGAGALEGSRADDGHIEGHSASGGAAEEPRVRADEPVARNEEPLARVVRSEEPLAHVVSASAKAPVSTAALAQPVAVDAPIAANQDIQMTDALSSPLVKA